MVLDGLIDYYMSGRIMRSSVIVVVLLVIGGMGVGQVTSGSQPGGKTQSFAVVQADSCHTIQPLGNGSKSVSALYNYRMHNYGYSSYGTRSLQIDGTSQFFLYRGNGGLSLVFLHDKIGTNSTAGGGVVTFELHGLPVTGGWTVKDDGYPEANDSFTFNGSKAVVTWGWEGNRTDGGAFQADPGAWDSQIRIVPHFNKESEAYPYPKWDSGTTANQVERWIVRSGDNQAYGLKLYQPITIHPGSCESLSQQAQKRNSSQPTDNNSSGNSQSSVVSTITDHRVSLGVGGVALVLLAALGVIWRRRE